ncbi:MAG: response regulator transcription factor [Ardenticatenaceae bacterium]|nr:response regulator transcription factor [Anaerolineales bacterium]MCB8941219.1 response regulator transcription factor [Ardenticatenaceae bacterium]MCB8972558.1 response regulator transcription factor [Ardenticatenaceae bacterium]
MSKIKLVLADDHAVVRSGLRMLLQAQPDMEIVGEAESGTEALRQVQTLQPDVILMDIQMPGMNGIEATRQIKGVGVDTAVLALTMHEDDQYFFEMLQAGASGYLPKRAAPDELVRAIRTVSRGEVFLYPSLATRLVQNYLGGDGGGDAVTLVSDLTPREQEVLVLIAEGLTNPEIAEKLVISVKTVDRHRENIMRKLNLHSRIELVKYALRSGLIDLEE